MSMEAIPPPKYPPTPLQDIFIRLIVSSKALQRDYHNVDLVDVNVWGNFCRAIDEADKNLPDILTKLHEGEYIEDWQKHLGHED